VYLGAIVVLATAMQQGVSPWRSRRLRELVGVSAQTLARWRTWWTEAFAESAFWKAAKAAFSPAVTESAVPLAIVDRFVGDEIERVAAMLRWLAPMSIIANAAPDRRR
jgi:hypothetical protein